MLLLNKKYEKLFESCIQCFTNVLSLKKERKLRYDLTYHSEELQQQIYAHFPNAPTLSLGVLRKGKMPTKESSVDAVLQCDPKSNTANILLSYKKGKTEEEYLYTTIHELQHYFDKILGYTQFQVKAFHSFSRSDHSLCLGEVRAYTRQLYTLLPKGDYNQKRLKEGILSSVTYERDDTFSRYFITTSSVCQKSNDVLDLVIDQLIHDGRWIGKRLRGYWFRETFRNLSLIISKFKKQVIKCFSNSI